LHLQYALGSGTIEYIELSDSNINDINIGKKIKIEANKLYIYDKGYCDYNWWKEIIDQGANFVTRLKSNASYVVKENYEVKQA
jgi:IS4 transposase